MDCPTQAVPEPVPEPVPESWPGARSYDPLAVALANASLLSAGYLMLGRRRLAVVTGAATVVLLAFLGSAARSVGFEVVVLCWWAALIAHGWFLAGGWRSRRVSMRGQWAVARTRRVRVRSQRLVALAVTLPVFLVAALLRWDAASTEGTVAGARRSGDCAQALDAQDSLWFGPRVADAPLTARGDKTVEACRRLATARSRLATGLTGNTSALQAGFSTLASVLADLPGHEKMVEVVLDAFLAGLPAKNPCDTVTVTDWLRARRTGHNVLDQSAGAVARTAPAALIGCGDDLLAAQNWSTARKQYQQLLDQYPGHPDSKLAAKAEAGVRKATLAIELDTVRTLLAGSTGEQPAYCSTPAKYSAAAPYRKGGPNHALFYGDDEYTSRLPAQWKATDPAHAVLVVCVDAADYGTRVETCPYENKTFPDVPTDVTFRKIAIPVKAYELRTGKLVVDTKVEIGGASCPNYLSYTTYSGIDVGPPSEEYVDPANADIRAAFTALITR